MRASEELLALDLLRLLLPSGDLEVCSRAPAAPLDEGLSRALAELRALSARESARPRARPARLRSRTDAEATQRALGIPLDAPDFPQRLAAYPGSSEVSAACSHCLGSSGPLAPHVQLRKRDAAAGRLA